VGIARILAPLAFAACANANPGLPDAKQSDAPPRDVSAPSSHCNPGEYATDVKQGQVVCASIDSATRGAVDDHCSVYLGWQDNCDACVTTPGKWGYAGGDRCINGAGADYACILPTLAGKAVRLYGINPDGDVDGNDKLHTSLHCTPAAASGATSPCPAGEFVTGSNGASIRCAPMATVVASYVTANCEVYAGWQDGCDGCVTAPTKWGHAGDANCTNGAGGDNTCTEMSLSGETVKMFGLNPDGDVDGNDKLHAGLRCVPVPTAMSTTMTVCPAGQFVVGVATDGSFECESPEPTIAQQFAASCSLYLGWSDGCEGCTAPPSKWGTARVGACANGAGGENTCTTFTFGNDQVALFGLNPDGDVDGNDTLYVGLSCR
jgi:hypothetical protein